MVESLENLKSTYRLIYDETVDSSDAVEIHNLLRPVAARITRVVAVGIGVPSAGNRETLRQLAMLEIMRDLLDVENDLFEPNLTKAFYSDSAINKDIDKQFLDDRQVDFINYDWNAEDEPDLPNYFRFWANDTQWWAPSLRNNVSAIADCIDSATLLFAPNLMNRPFMKLLASSKPVMIIGNQIEGVYKFCCQYELADPVDAEPFREQWNKEMRALDELRDHFWRTNALGKFTAYSKAPRATWITGAVGIDEETLMQEFKNAADQFEEAIPGESLDDYERR